MKKLILLLLLLPIITVCNGDNIDDNKYIDKTILNKIDPMIKKKCNDLKKEDKLDNELNLIIKTKETLTTDERQELEDLGVIIHTVVGNIFTSKTPAKSVWNIASLDYIIRIELAKKVHLK